MGKVRDMALSGWTGKYKFAKKEDLEEVCNKCKQAYYGDFLPQDCYSCNLSKLIEICRNYAWELTVGGIL